MEMEDRDEGWRGLAGTEMENEGSRIEMGSEKEGGGKAKGLLIEYVCDWGAWKESKRILETGRKQGRRT